MPRALLTRSSFVRSGPRGVVSWDTVWATVWNYHWILTGNGGTDSRNNCGWLNTFSGWRGLVNRLHLQTVRNLTVASLYTWKDVLHKGTITWTRCHTDRFTLRVALRRVGWISSLWFSRTFACVAFFLSQRGLVFASVETRGVGREGRQIREKVILISFCSTNYACCRSSRNFETARLQNYHSSSIFFVTFMGNTV